MFIYVFTDTKNVQQIYLNKDLSELYANNLQF